jgi:PAS domain S-box-containing protein
MLLTRISPAANPSERHRIRILVVAGLVFTLAGGILLLFQLALWLIFEYPTIPLSDLFSDLMILGSGLTILYLVSIKRDNIAVWILLISLQAFALLQLTLDGNPLENLTGTFGLFLVIALGAVLLKNRQLLASYVVSAITYLAILQLWKSGIFPEPVPRNSSPPEMVFHFIAWVLTSGFVVVIIQSTTSSLKEQTRKLRQRVEIHQATEESLQESERQLSQIMDNLPGAVFRRKFPLDGSMDFLSKGVENLTGYPPDEFYGEGSRDWFSLVDVDDQKGIWAVIQKALSSGEGYQVEYRLTPKTGPLKWVWEQGQPIRTAEDVILEEGLIIDITQRKEAQREVKRHLSRLQALREIDRVISSSLELNEVLGVILREIQPLISFDTISIQLVHEQGTKIAACRGFDQPEKYLGMYIPFDPAFPNQDVIEQQQPIAAADIHKKYPGFVSDSDPESTHKIISWLGVPLISRGSPIGLIALDRHQMNPFTEQEISTATTFAGQAAIAVENARLFRKTNQQLKHLQSLHQIDQAIASSFDLRITLQMVLNQAIANLDVDAADVLLFDPELQTLSTAAIKGFANDDLNQATFQLGQGLPGKSALTQNSCLYSDEANKDLKKDPRINKEGFSSYGCQPLIAKGELEGVLEVYSHRPLPIDREWQSFFSALATQTAIAINNISRMENLHRDTNSLRISLDAILECCGKVMETHGLEPPGHTDAVYHATRMTAKAVALPEIDQQALLQGVLLHDLGLLFLDRELVLSSNPLAPEPDSPYRRHPIIATEVLSGVPALEKALDIPLYHHERWDGSGYPKGLSGIQIPPEARLFAVVDTWYILQHDYPNQLGLSPAQVEEYLENQAGHLFDPEMVAAFQKTL